MSIAPPILALLALWVAVPTILICDDREAALDLTPDEMVVIVLLAYALWPYYVYWLYQRTRGP